MQKKWGKDINRKFTEEKQKMTKIFVLNLTKNQINIFRTRKHHFSPTEFAINTQKIKLNGPKGVLNCTFFFTVAWNVNWFVFSGKQFHNV